MRILGMMSGTSLDGIDAAIIDTDGISITNFGPANSFPYLAGEKAAIQSAIVEALEGNFTAGAVWPESFSRAEKAITEAHIRVVNLMRTRHDTGVIDLIGFHGQTILHRPNSKITLQLGDARGLARACGVDVIGDFRSHDMALGGQGAPLVPVYHQALLKRSHIKGPVAVLNIGGVANLTYTDASDRLIAFDTGPGNGLLDQWMTLRGLGEFDRDGALSATGTVNQGRLAELMTHRYFEAPVPKSLDRYDFSLDNVNGLSDADGAATLAAFTAAAVKRAIGFLPSKPMLWIICGGGRKNATIMAELRRQIRSRCVDADDFCWHGDDIEAEAFGYLAARWHQKLPITFPGTTGIDQPTPGGRLFSARREGINI